MASRQHLPRQTQQLIRLSVAQSNEGNPDPPEARVLKRKSNLRIKTLFFSLYVCIALLFVSISILSMLGSRFIYDKISSIKIPGDYFKVKTVNIYTDSSSKTYNDYFKVDSIRSYIDYFTATPRKNYITAPIERGSIVTTVRATGTVNAVLTVDVSSQLSGPVSDVFVNFNDDVKAGQVIARIDPETYIARVNEAKAALKIANATVQLQQASVERTRSLVANARTSRAAAEAQAAGVRARFAETERNLKRRDTLARAGNVSEVELSRARTQRETDAADLRVAERQLEIKAQEIVVAEADYRMAEANLATAEGVVEQKQAALDQATVDLGRTDIRAPIDGTVIKRDINPGQTIAVDVETKILFKIAKDLRSMEVYGKIDEADVGRLRVGQIVNFTVDAYPDQMFSGRVLQIQKSPEVVQNVVTYRAVISAPNQEQLLFPGMTADLRITVNETADTLKIPNQALSFATTIKLPNREQMAAPDTDSSVVWVLDGEGKPVPAKATFGKSDNTATQVLSGNLVEGQRVVIGVEDSPERHKLFGFLFGL